MGFVPHLSQPHREASPGLASTSNFERPSKRLGRGLLSPTFAETAVVVGDVVLILGAFLLSSFTYYLLTADTLPSVLPYGGIGLVVAVNFVAIMTARRNYRLKNLMLFSKQAREIVLAWSGLYGLLALLAFTVKISSDF